MTDSENDSTNEKPPTTTPDTQSQADESPAGGEQEPKASGRGHGRERGKRSEGNSAADQKSDADSGGDGKKSSKGDDDRDSSQGGSSRSGSGAGRSRSRRKPKTAAAKKPRESNSSLDPDEWQNKAWKFYLADISEEGTGMFDDQEAKKLAKRSFDLAAIYLRTRDQIVGSPSKAAPKPEQDAATDGGETPTAEENGDDS